MKNMMISYRRAQKPTKEVHLVETQVPIWLLWSNQQLQLQNEEADITEADITEAHLPMMLLWVELLTIIIIMQQTKLSMQKPGCQCC
jgi:hypothetical protein